MLQEQTAQSELADDAIERLLTVREVAPILSVSIATVYKLCARGELRHVRVSNAIRIPRSELGAFLRGSPEQIK